MSCLSLKSNDSSGQVDITLANGFEGRRVEQGSL